MNTPKSITGIGTINGTSATKTPTTNSSAKMLPNKRKLRDNGLLKSSNTLIGNKKTAGEI